jgi:chaperonin GroEL
MARIVAGAGVHRLLDASLRPVIRAIGLTLGPDRRSVLHEHGPRAVAEAATGFAVAREMPIATGPWGLAPRLLKETLFAADRDLGDGTARLALIAGACFSSGVREMAAGAAARPLCEAMQRLSEEIAGWLIEAREPQVNLLHVARACGLGEPLAGKLADVVREFGADASIDVKENDGAGIELTKSDGFALDARPIGNEALAALTSPSILVADEIIHDFGSLAPVLEGFANKRKPLVIVARDITGPALATLKRNQQADIVTVAALQPAGAAERAADSLEDLAIATGAVLIAERLGMKLESLRPPMLGQASGFRFGNGRAMFTAPKGKAEDIAFRRSMLKAAAEKARYLSYDRELLERRRGRLSGQWCELRVAADTSQATLALLSGTRAAVCSMQSALAHGAVPGGGAFFAGLALRLATRKGTDAERAAARAVTSGLLAIPRQLAANAGFDPILDATCKAPVQDPIALTKTVIDQGIGLALALLRTGAVIAR